jgi:UDP-N-acetylglucosamine--N-acetylmuramyl-(pentapeptide) pyrophosphoryl-undecaprenol N-acetylglucosamine transferase
MSGVIKSDALVILAAGGTGGHLFPAQALAEVLVRRGYRIQLVTDERVGDYGKDFPAEKTHVVPAATMSMSQPWKVPRGLMTMFQGLLKSLRILKHEKPRAIVGFGGYPSFAPLRAAVHSSVPVIVHEANAVLGRANGKLAPLTQVIALSFRESRGLSQELIPRTVFTGNPVRAAVIAKASVPYPVQSSKFNLLIFGGSQGARFFSEFMPGVFERISPDVRGGIRVVQQCRPEDVERVKAAYQNLGLDFELAAFFGDLPQRIADAHLVIARAGASTIAELAVIGRPAMLVPLPGAIDNDQLFNAKSFESGGAGWVFPQNGLAHEAFAAQLEGLLRDRPRLLKAANSAKLQGKANAAESLADVVEGVIMGKKTV